MPPIKKTTKEDIIEVAYSIVRKEGIEGLNARLVAEKLNCSVQPIFHNFQNMEELKKEVIKKVFETYHKYLLTIYDENMTQYKNMGLGYIKFAKEDTKLFQILFMSEHDDFTEQLFENDKILKKVEENISDAAKLEKEKIATFHAKIWIFTHGLATLIATHTINFSDEEINNLLKEMFMASKMYEEGKNNEKSN